MQHYCGIDLHSNNHVVVIIDEKDKRVFEKRLGNVYRRRSKCYNLTRIHCAASLLNPHSTGNWLADGLQVQGYHVQRVNTAAVVKHVPRWCINELWHRIKSIKI